MPVIGGPSKRPVCSLSTAGGEGKAPAAGEVQGEGDPSNQQQRRHIGSNCVPCRGAELQAALQLSSPELLSAKLRNC